MMHQQVAVAFLGRDPMGSPGHRVPLQLAILQRDSGTLGCSVWVLLVLFQLGANETTRRPLKLQSPIGRKKRLLVQVPLVTRDKVTRPFVPQTSAIRSIPLFSFKETSVYL